MKSNLLYNTPACRTSYNLAYFNKPSLVVIVWILNLTDFNSIKHYYIELDDTIM